MLRTTYYLASKGTGNASGPSALPPARNRLKLRKDFFILFALYMIGIALGCYFVMTGTPESYSVLNLSLIHI